MPKLFVKIFSSLFFYVLIFSTNILFASADKIIISGNKNISETTIRSYLPSNFKNSDPDLLNNFQKNLYSTGFFKNIEIKVTDNNIFVNVIENPLVNFVLLEGITNKGVKDSLYEIIALKENTIFQDFKIKNDIKKINNYLNKLGYLKNDVNYEIKIIENNKVNIFYNINLNNKFRISRIFFIGEKFFKSSTLKDVISSTEHGWWKFLSNFTTPYEELINSDISKLKKFYLDSGFYDVQINSNTISILDNNYANITFSINSGGRYTLKKISIIDLTKFLKKEDFDYINDLINPLKNNVFNFSEVIKVKNFIDQYLNNSNYNLSLNIKLTKLNSNNLSLDYIIEDTAVKKIIEKIIISGNNITDDFVIRNSLSFSEGDNFNQSKLNSSKEKLIGKNIFKNINVSEQEIKDGQTDDVNKVNILISVEETATGEISAGAGAGTNGATISGSLNEKNFLGKGISLASNLSIGTQQILGSLTYLDSDFNNSGNTFKSSVFVTNNDFENASFENKIIGASIFSVYEIYDKLFIEPGFSVDFDSVSVNSDASSTIKKREGDFFTSKVSYKLFKNTKNRDFNPTEGYTFGAGQGLSLISDISYINNSIFGSYYNEYADNFIGSIKYKLENINGFNKDIKFSDRLFVPSNNLRGFASRGIGPKIDNDFIGGNYSFYTTLSSTIPNGLPDKWNAITNIFFDTANVWGVDDNSTGDSNMIRSSVGLGFSWVSPLGPISFTYAEPITKEKTDDIEQFNFKIGSAF